VKLAKPRLSRQEALAGVVGGVVAAIVLILYASGVLNNLERQSVDERFSWRGGQSCGDQIVIVAVDQTTLQTLGVRPPLPRSAYAKVVDHVHAASPRAIGIDTQFIGRSDPAEDKALLEAVARDGPVLLATHDGPQGPIPVPANTVDAPGVVAGSAAIDRDPDGVLRRMLEAPVALKTFAVRAAELARNQPVNAADFPDNHAWIDFRGPPGTFPRYSFADVLAGNVSASSFAGKTVLIGVTDPVNDVFVTSISPVPMPAVEVNANAVWTVLAGIPLTSVGAAIDVALILALIAIPVAVGARKSGLFTLASSGVVLAVFVAVAQLAFNAGSIVTVVYPIVGLLVATAGMIGVDAYAQRRQNADLKRDLGDLHRPQKPPAFFISYRRSQNTWQARDIRKELARRYGESRVFMDASSIDYGESFPDRIASAIRGCSVILGLIGPHWLEPTPGSRRIDDPDDWVRRELEAALERREALLIPVLLDGASVPAAEDLPESLRGLAMRHAVVIVGDDLATDIDNLLRSIKRGQRRADEGDDPTGTQAGPSP
jgi:CHASE2 domain-containing sensor protein